jgi:hypothetical protein
MGTLIFVCPATGHEVSTGLEMDVDTFATLPSEPFDVTTVPNRINFPSWPFGCLTARDVSTAMLEPPREILLLPKVCSSQRGVVHLRSFQVI